MNASQVLKGLLHGGSMLETSSAHTQSKQCTTSDGKRVELKLKQNPGGFKRRVLNEISNETVDISQLLTDIQIEEGVSKTKDDTDVLLDSITTIDDPTLWTEKYRPKKFIDLIGNERVNSQILKWLNDWNHCVSNGSIKEDGIDPLNRPLKKFLLIHGPPGIGKTTIGHCIANQLKYDINEINSSDERSGEAVRNKILNSLKVNNLNGKKICLILDEVDGASNKEGGFLRMLVQLSQKDKRTVDKFKINGEKFKNGDLLKRPIILICNDIYSPVLDQIKQHCEIFQFKRPTNSDIKKRLKKIIEMEHIKVQDSLIDDLIISMDGDIRNCINFLQFNSNNGSLNGRLKDSQIAWFQTLKMIFNRRASINKKDQFNSLFRDLSNSNDRIDKIINGSFNGILQIDNLNLEKYNEINQWFEFFDEFHKNSRLFERDELINYTMITPLKCFQMFNEIGMNKEINFKSIDNYDLKKSIETTIREMNYKNFNTNLPNLKIYEIDMLFNIIIPLNIPLKKLSIDNEKLLRIIELVKSQELKFESVKSGNYFSRDILDRFRPDIGIMKESRSNGDESIVSGYISLLKGLSATQKRKAEQMSPVAEIIKTKESGMGSRSVSSFGHVGDRVPDSKRFKIGSSVDFFKRQYTSFTQSNQNAAGESSVMNGNQYRVWIKFHEGFSNAVRKETTWELLFESGKSGA